MTYEGGGFHTTDLDALRHDSLSYRSGELFLEATPLSRVAEVVQTPFYCYSTFSIVNSYRLLDAALRRANVSICFAVKANSNVSVLRLLCDIGCGMDIVSGGELSRALAAGARPERIVFSGVGKTKAELMRAIRAGIHQINVESPAELDDIRDAARTLGRRVPIVLRVNPDVDAKTHEKISTGRRGDKFGISFREIPDLYARAVTFPELDVAGLAVHIGSQLLDLTPYRTAYSRLASLVRQLRSQSLPVRRLDLGGGLGIHYNFGTGPDINEYAAMVHETVGDLACELTVEPGRWLVGPSGLLVTEVINLKDADGTIIAVVDAAMNDLMRPALYHAVHPVLPLLNRGDHGETAYKIVGPVCESSDVFGTYDGLPALRSGTRIAFACAGAYGASMASTYNSRDLIAEVLVDRDRFRLIRHRQTTENLLQLEGPAPWQPACSNADMATTF